MTQQNDKIADVTVIIPTLNGANQLRELLASFTIQTLKPNEVIIVDSSSTDNSVQVAEEYGAEVLTISRDEFDHGGTRTKMAKKAKNEIVVYFTQDALPIHRRVLEELVKPILNSAEVAVSYGRQFPTFRAEEIAKHLRLFNYSDQSYIRSYSDRFNFGLKTVFASNSCAAYRKTSLEEIGFFKNDLIFGEDTCAVGSLLKQGYSVAYVADAGVYHSHNYSWSEEFRRYFDIGVLHSVENWLLQTYGSAEGRGKDYVVSGISYLYKRRNYSLIGDFMVRTALKYVGYRLGRHYKKLPGKVRPEFSMNRNWWDRKNY